MPRRPMACANGSAGTTAARASPRSMPWRRTIHKPTSIPAAIPPGIPRPPFQMAKISSQPSSWNFRQSVITWYRRDPIKPAGTAHSAIRGQDAKCDHHPVGAQLQRPQAQAVPGRARYRRDDLAGDYVHPGSTLRLSRPVSAAPQQRDRRRARLPPRAVRARRTAGWPRRTEPARRGRQPPRGHPAS